MKNKELVLKIILGIVVVILIGVILFLSCRIYKKANFETKNPIATMEIEGCGILEIELYPDVAPNTVANFVKLANNGFYDGLTFHRILKDFMAQGGDKSGDGTGTPTLGDLKKDDDEAEYSIKGEFAANNFTKNNLKFTKGVIGMARSDFSSLGTAFITRGYNSAGSQFFIMLNDNGSSLDGQYTSFGKVIREYEIKVTTNEETGEEIKEEVEANVLEKLANTDVVMGEGSADYQASQPVNPPVIKSVRVETYGVDYGMPETEEPFDYYNYIMSQYTSGMTTGE